MAKKKASSRSSSSCCCSSSCVIIVVVCIAVILSGLRELNIRGPKLWFAPVPTADLSISLEGKVAIVTGANTGIGLQMTKALAAMGADVILGCRSAKKGENAIKSIEEEVQELAKQYQHTPGALEVISLDLGSFASIHSFVDSVKKRRPERKAAVDILVNNAGLISNNTRITEDGFRDMIGVNYFGPFLLTHLLLPDLLASSQNENTLARIVNVASNSHKYGEFNFEDIDHSSVDGSFHWHYVYGTSKTGNVLFTQSLAKRVEGSGLIVTTNHPGVIKTDIARSFQGIVFDVGIFLTSPMAMSPWQGAQNTIYGATSNEAQNGEYYDRFDATPPTWAFENVDGVREKLWDYSCERVGVQNFDSWKELV